MYFFKSLFLLFFSAQCFAIKPDRKYVTTPKEYRFRYQEVKIPTPDKALINVWNIMPVATATYQKTTIVLCGSDAANMSYLLSVSLALASEGYNVISFDYRGFGQSVPFVHDSTLLFHKEYLIDFEAVIQYAKTTFPQNKIGTLGFSMGGYFPLITKEKLDFLIADSPMTSPKNLLERLNKPSIKLPQNYIEPKPTAVPHLYFLGDKDKLFRKNDFQNPSVVAYKGGHLEAEYTLQNDFYNQINAFIKGIPNKIQN